MTWGPWTTGLSNNFRCGWTYTRSGSSVYITYRVQGQYVANSSATLNYSGNWSGSRSFRYEQSGGVMNIWTSPARSINRGQRYSHSVSVKIGYNGASPSHTRTLTFWTAGAPSKVSRPTVSNISHDRARVNWSAPNNNGASIERYQVQWATNSSFSANVANFNPGTTRNHTRTGRSPNTLYYVRVRARNSKGWGAWSDSRSFRTLANYPTAPGAPTFSNVTSSSITATVSAASPRGSSIIEYQHGRALSSNFTTGNSNWNTSSRSRASTGLEPYTLYYWRSRARNSRGWGAWSPTRSQRTKARAPVIGDVPAASNITRNSAYFTGWKVADTGGQSPSNIRVQYNTSQSTSGAQIETRGAWAAVTLTGLQADTQYYYRGSIYNSGGWSSWSGWQTFTTLDDAPDDVEEIRVDAIYDDHFIVSWDQPEMNGAVFQAMEWELSDTDSFANLLWGGFFDTESPSYSVTPPGHGASLDPGTDYYFRARVRATPNNGGWASIKVTTTGIKPESGMRAYLFHDGQMRQGSLYTFVDGQRIKLRPMFHDGNELRTE